MTPERQPSSRNRESTTVVLVVLLLGLPWVAYFPVGSFEFVNYDDDVYITNNPNVTEGLTRDALVWTLTTPQHGNWHPLTMITHMIDVDLWEMDAGGHHLTSVAIHSINTALLFLFLWQLTGRRWPSVVVAALFAVHPLNVQSVAWIAERKNVLSTLFWLLALIAWVAYMRRADWKRYLIVAALFVLGLASKPMVVTLPLTLLILDWWSRQEGAALTVVRGESWRRLILEKVPLLLGSLGLGLATMWAQGHSGAMKATEVYPLGVRLGNAVVAYTWYLRKMIWPSELSVFYPHPVHTLEIWKIAVSGLTLIAITAFVVWAGRRRPYLIAGWAWYLTTLAPVAGIVQVGSQAQADRYAYVPLIGIFVAVVWTVADLVAARGRQAVVVTSAVAAIVIASLAFAAHANLMHWRNGESLFAHAARIDPQNRIALGNLGIALVQQDRVDEALPHFRAAVEAGPEIPTAHLNLANALAMLNQPREAEKHYRESIRLDPTDARPHHKLGMLLAGTGRHDEAVVEFRETVRLDPGHQRARVSLAMLLTSSGRLQEVVELLQPVVETDPTNAPAHYMLGLAFEARGELSAALPHLERAAELAPENPRTGAALERVRRRLAGGTP